MRSIFSYTIMLVFVHLFVFNKHADGQTAIVPFDSLHWNIQAKQMSMENFEGKQCIKIIDGAAYLKDSFENGIIEFDISFDKERCFPGLMFRMMDEKNLEFLYLRPHQSGNPDAIQYCPIFFGNDSWQLYNGQGYCAQAEFAMNTWIHVKVIIAGTKAELYLNNASSPILFMHHLQRKPAMGGLALDNHSAATVRFANFSYSKSDNPSLKTETKILNPLPVGMIKKWKISNVFSEKNLDDKIILDEATINNLSWQNLETEELGFINIGKYITRTNDGNTVFAKFTITSDKDQIIKMPLGFSDRCKVYLNNQLLYAGNNTFKVRDYRFYGTIGLWDEVYLNLKKGNNKIMIAVSENFGGWGVEAKIDETKDLMISN